MRKRIVSMLLIMVLLLLPLQGIASAQAVPEAGAKKTRRLEGVKVGIDPGHQKKADKRLEPIAPDSKEKKARCSSGTSGVKTKKREYVVNLEVALLLRDMLEEEGATVYLTRTRHDVNISNVERTQYINGKKVDIYLRLHCDGSDNASKNGIGLYVRKTGSKRRESLAAAEALMKRMTKATGAKEYGIFKRDTYTGLNWATVPAILVEMGFMSNAKEDVKLSDIKYQKKLCTGMIEGICDFLGKA